MSKYSQRHGGPYDRGSADSYYGRKFDPHYYLADTYNSKRIGQEDMTTEEIEAYAAGYSENEEADNHKYY